MFAKFILLASMAALVSSGSVGYENCGNNDSAEIIDMRVEGCEGNGRCMVFKGANVAIEVDAISKSTSNTLPYTITAVVVIPIVIESGDACEGLTVGDCPATVGEEFTYATSLNVNADFPVLDTTVTATVKDDRGNVVICTKVPIGIRNAPRDDLLAISKYFKAQNKPLLIAH